MKNIGKKWVIKGRIKTLSPLVVGTGDDSSDTDIIIQKDPEGNPLIPATSLAGALRHAFFEQLKIEESEKKAYRRIWGDSFQENGKEVPLKSSLYFEDMQPLKNVQDKIELRDGIKIDPKRGIVEDKGKYDYEMLARGAEFPLHIEVVQARNDDKKRMKTLISSITRLLENGKVRLGGMNTKGYGKVQLRETRVLEYDFNDKRAFLDWITKNEALENHLGEEERKALSLKENEKNDLIIEAGLKLKTSLLIRSYSTDPNAPDASYMKSNDQPVIPGPSLKGALRQRGEKIMRTIAGPAKPENAIQSLFGFVETEDGAKKGENKKSRFYAEESVYELDKVVEKIQARIRIDRFTGGTIKTALFDEMPLWPEGEEEMFKVTFSIKDCKEWEAGLALLILKDLMTGDLAVGGGKSIGRGVFEGVFATINYDNRSYKFHQNGKIDFKKGSKEELESYVRAFNESFKGV